MSLCHLCEVYLLLCASISEQAHWVEFSESFMKMSDFRFFNVHCGVCYSLQNHVAVWSGKKLEVYVISPDRPTVRDAGEC